MIPEPVAVAVDCACVPNTGIFEVTLYSIFIPTIEGKILLAAYTAVSE